MKQRRRNEAGRWVPVTKANFPSLFPELDSSWLGWFFGYLRSLYLAVENTTLSDNDRRHLEAMLVGILEKANE